MYSKLFEVYGPMVLGKKITILHIAISTCMLFFICFFLLDSDIVIIIICLKHIL